jgi:DNA-binding GntR family transcriptional regulator
MLAGRTDLGLSPADPVPDAFDNHEAIARAIMDRDEDRAEQYAKAVVLEVWQELGNL